jgi:flagellar biogenesis protein FliO
MAKGIYTLVALATVLLGVVLPSSAAETASDKPSTVPAWGVSEAPAGPPLGRLVMGLAACLGSFFIGVHLFKRFQSNPRLGGERRMRVVERLPISQKSSLLLVTIDGREYLVGAGSEAPTLCRPINEFHFMDDEVCDSSTDRVAA